MLNDNRIRVITGSYGTGKTEFSVNYALKLAAAGNKTALVDLDVINLYFRSREKQEELEAAGVRVISSSIKGRGADLPAVSAEAAAPLQDTSWQVVLDVGGDAMGARALSRYRTYFQPGEYDMFFVVNANRPETATLAGVREHLEAIQRVSQIPVTALVNNTHLVKETTLEDVLRGQCLCRQLSEATGLPLRYTSLLESLVPQVASSEVLDGTLFPLSLIMREAWMS
ncbi:ATP-binding protein [Anoxynatronum sibiricum]|uniref:ATP-binding protein n=1 Tax=Anoxynatronum sibiricum TaxID=210623 RepID=A0ABU9VRX9_9CLOT